MCECSHTGEVLLGGVSHTIGSSAFCTRLRSVFDGTMLLKKLSKDLHLGRIWQTFCEVLLAPRKRIDETDGGFICVCFCVETVGEHDSIFNLLAGIAVGSLVLESVVEIFIAVEAVVLHVESLAGV